MVRAKSVCPVAGCAELTEGGRCAKHKAEADRARGTSAERGYNSRQWRATRRALLRRDKDCRVCGQEPATVADHYPRSRKELLEMGVSDPDALYRLRGLCARCHSKETAKHQPGGWNRRD